MAQSAVSSARRRLTRVVVFYVALLALVAVAVRYVPGVAEILTGSRLAELGAGESELFGPNAPTAVGSPISGTPWSGAFLGAVSMLGALAIMIPVTWVYMVTRQRRGYDESVVHTLLILPVAVTGIVMIVQHSLALAFSLAGIVAAVRFRTTLEDTKDAVYVFLAIGVGLASGVQALGLAFVLSVIFNGVILVLWRSRFGNLYVDLGTGPGGLTLGDAMAGPESYLTAKHVGDPAALEAASPRDLAEVADRALRMERYISEERTMAKRKRANTLLLVTAPEAASAQGIVEAALEELSTRWKLMEIVPSGSAVIMEYVARLDGPGVEGALMDRLREAESRVIRGAEIRSLKGLKKRS